MAISEFEPSFRHFLCVRTTRPTHTWVDLLLSSLKAWSRLVPAAYEVHATVHATIKGKKFYYDSILILLEETKR